MNEQALIDFLKEFGFYFEKPKGNLYTIREIEFDSIIFLHVPKMENEYLSVMVEFTRWIMNDYYNSGFTQGVHVTQKNIKKALGIEK